jgi:TIR domain
LRNATKSDTKVTCDVRHPARIRCTLTRISTMKQWDVFISHASEDKESAARPLASALRQSGARVWLDDSELKLGDSLREKIDEGLANSRYGVVILSPRFFEKKWTKAELDGLFARDVVLPVWLDVTADDLLRMSPMLAGKLAGQMKDGVDHVAHQIIEKLFSVGDAVRKQAGSAEHLANLNDFLLEMQVRTYDWMLDNVINSAE